MADQASITNDRNLFRSFQLRNQRERRRERENWRMYDATEFGQWDDQALRIMLQEGRPPTSFNFTKRYVDTLAGSLLADPFELHYETELGEENDIAVLMNELYMEDRDLGNFANEYLLFLRAGFVYRGWLEMYKDYSRDPRGRVGMRYISPDRILTDPDWVTANVCDNKTIFMWTWMSPRQIKDKYRKKMVEIDNAVQLFEEYREETMGEPEKDKLFDTSPEFWDKQNGLFLVIDKYELRTKRKMRLFDPEAAAFLRDMEDEDADIFYETSDMMGRKLEKIEQTVKECHLTTMCPGLSLSMVLQEGRHPLQLGKYPFFTFSADSINGRPNTAVDQLKDAQVTFNKREATITHILMTSANNALLIEDDAAEADVMHEIGKKRNRPGAYFIVTPGTNSAGKIKHIDRTPPPNNFMDAANHIWGIAEKITASVPAVQGVGEGQDSGVLFQAKVAQAQIGMQLPQKFLKAVWQQIGDAYFFAAKQTYSYPMIFASSDSKKLFNLNMEGGVQMSDLTRLRLTVTQSASSETYRRQLLQQYIAISQYLPDPLTRQALSRLVVKSLPNVPQEELDALADVAKLSEEYQKQLTLMQIAQIHQAMGQMQAPPGGMPGMPGTGGPMPGMPPGGAPSGGAPQQPGPGSHAGMPPGLAPPPQNKGVNIA